LWSWIPRSAQALSSCGAAGRLDQEAVSAPWRGAHFTLGFSGATGLQGEVLSVNPRPGPVVWARLGTTILCPCASVSHFYNEDNDICCFLFSSY